MKLTKRVKGWLGLAMLIGQLTNLIPPAHAQTAGWSATLDFSTSDRGWTQTLANGTSPGWISGLGWSSGTAGFWVNIEKTISGGDSTTRLTSATIRVVSTGATEMDSRVPPNNELNFDIDFAEIYHGYVPFPFATGEGVYTMDNGIAGGTLKISAHSHDDGSGGISGQYTAITYLHLTGTGTPPDLDLDPTAIPMVGVDGTCKICAYNPTGDWVVDAANLVNFGVCQISNIYFCVLIPILMGIWNTIFKILIYLQSIAAAVPINTMIVVRYGSGYAQNLTNQVVESVGWSNSNAYIISSGSGSNLADIFIALITQIGGLFQGLYKLFGDLTTAIKDIVNTLIGGAVQVLSLLINAIFGFSITLINAVLWFLLTLFRFVSIIPQFAGTFAGAFSQTLDTPTVIPGDIFIDASTGGGSGGGSGLRVMSPPRVSGAGFHGAPTTRFTFNCDSPVMFHVCLAWYVADNTIYDGTGRSGWSSFINPQVALTILMAMASLVVFIRWMKKLLGALGYID